MHDHKRLITTVTRLMVSACIDRFRSGLFSFALCMLVYLYRRRCRRTSHFLEDWFIIEYITLYTSHTNCNVYALSAILATWCWAKAVNLGMMARQSSSEGWLGLELLR